MTVAIQSDRFRSALEKAAAGWARPPHIVACDVTRDEDIDAAFAAIAERHGGKLHALAHSLAFAPAAAMKNPLLETTRADFALAHGISAYSLIALARGAAPLMDAAGGGSVMALSYLGAARAAPSYRVMGPAKASLEATARGLAAELGPRGIRVNCISAGPIDTLAARGIAGFTVRGGFAPRGLADCHWPGRG